MTSITNTRYQYFVTYSAAVLIAFILLLTASSPLYAQQEQLDVPQGTNDSLNWSGYVADTGSNYSSVTGTWIVPEVSSSTSGTADAAWVGIGGVKSRDLIQAGTQAVVEEGQISYNAWLETLPGVSRTVPLSVTPGDSVTATLTQESAGVWQITIKNNTTGKTYSRSVAYDSSNSSAEWVEEMVSNVDGTFRPLDSFGMVSFINASATVDGVQKNLHDLEAEPLSMISGNGDTLATASAVGGDNASFSVSRTNAVAVTSETPVTTTRRHRYYVVPQAGTSYTTYRYHIDGLPIEITYTIQSF